MLSRFPSIVPKDRSSVHDVPTLFLWKVPIIDEITKTVVFNKPQSAQMRKILLQIKRVILISFISAFLSLTQLVLTYHAFKQVCCIIGFHYISLKSVVALEEE